MVSSRIAKVTMPVVSVILALLAGAVIILAIGKNPVFAYGQLIQGAFGNSGQFGETIVKATPLLFTGLAATFAYRCGLINLGAEGQFIAGSIASIAFYINVGRSWPGPAALVVGLMLGVVAGGLWGFIPGLLKARFAINEMIVTILLNYIITLFMAYLFSGPMMEGTIPQTGAVARAARLEKLMVGSRAHIGIVIAVIVAALVWFILFKTSFGFRLRAVGHNPVGARVNGYGVARLMTLSMVISGAIAGLGGSVELHGASYRLLPGFGRGFGFDGVAIALIGGLNPLGTVVAAYFFAVLRVGANAMQISAGIPTTVVDIIQALVIIFVAASTALTHQDALKQWWSRMRPPPGKRVVPAADDAAEGAS